MHISFSPDSQRAAEITFDDFLRVDIRAGTVLEASLLEGLRNPSIRLVIDFGPAIGVKKSAARITQHYSPEALVGQQVMAVVNFPPRQIGPFMSEVLTLGVADETGAIRLIAPDAAVADGTRLS